ncbi:PcfJ domain-containing protein [Bradyrhizobium xenonodulans]|uniref:PcfJ domain-containing protein n=1 Tax=Bradyrhizobium xenonodulans TaxID=2736875 RepID=A0ABY7MD61_9BRAD|nr:PcfJ domain-containing protein [Bradyrhizobium xenonodulans]WBL76298.1 PcfJ domain-containing protein [Bradyrhizobium xenonodulans]
MAHSLIQRRREAERARVEAYELSLRHVSQRTRPPPDFETAIYEAKRGFEADIVRDAEAWKPRMKTRDAARLRLTAARYLFARYPVAEHLEQIWVDGAGLGADEIRLRKRWYIAAAGGGSLYGAGAAEWLSRKEVHAFLNPMGDVGFEAAIWQAIARSHANDPGVALRIARTRITQTPRAQHRFWREVVRFFCAHPTTVEDMDDFHDYLADCHRRDPEYTLKGRSLISLGRQMREWHRDLDAIARIEAARRRAEAARNRARGLAVASEQIEDRWLGAAIADWSWTTSSKDRAKREEYVVVQLRTADALVAETRGMRHCVASYATKCIAGHASIWSLRRRAAGSVQRLLTIELDPRFRAVQVRGFANRPPLAEESKILARWAQARGIMLL